MSKRLSFLGKARPEAASAYFEFLKESGKYLDDKTRFLISVVTKVISGTPSGLKQYTPHAIRAGATGDEIVDAILMSFPAAGLTKVLDAFDVLQEIDLPELRIGNLGKKSEWYDICPLSELTQDKVTIKEYGGRRLVIYHTDKNIKVYDGRCPHLGNKLSDKSEGKTLRCAVHKWNFDLETTECIEKGDRPLHSYPCRVDNDRLMVEMIFLD